jgi:hypothetical protein
VRAGENPIGYRFRCEFVLADMGAGLILNSTGFFSLAGMKMLYPCPQTRVPAMDIYVYIYVCVCVCLCVFIYMYACIYYIHTCLYMYIYMCV